MHDPQEERSARPPVLQEKDRLPREPNPQRDYQQALLAPLAAQRETYLGTASPAAVAKRRTRNKAARKSRRANRK